MSDEKLLQAVEELRLFLEHSQDAASRLKQEVPSSEFPTAYQLGKNIRELRKVVDSLRAQLIPNGQEYTMQIFESDRLSGSDSMIGH